MAFEVGVATAIDNASTGFGFQDTTAPSGQECRRAEPGERDPTAAAVVDPAAVRSTGRLTT
jgi:hypothetical protein